jgi:hypothetical protein
MNSRARPGNIEEIVYEFFFVRVKKLFIFVLNNDWFFYLISSEKK